MRHKSLDPSVAKVTHRVRRRRRRRRPVKVRASSRVARHDPPGPITIAAAATARASEPYGRARLRTCPNIPREFAGNAF